MSINACPAARRRQRRRVARRHQSRCWGGVSYGHDICSFLLVARPARRRGFPALTTFFAPPQILWHRRQFSLPSFRRAHPGASRPKRWAMAFLVRHAAGLFLASKRPGRAGLGWAHHTILGSHQQQQANRPAQYVRGSIFVYGGVIPRCFWKFAESGSCVEKLNNKPCK